MPLQNLPECLQHERLTATKLNEIVAEVNRRSKMFAAPPLYLTDGQFGMTLTYSDGTFWATVCGTYSASSSGSSAIARSRTPYSVKEVVPDSGGNWRLMGGGREGIVYPTNNQTLYSGTIIKVSPGFGGEWVTDSYPPASPPIPLTCSPAGSGSSSGASSGTSSAGSSGTTSSIIPPSVSSCQPGYVGCVPYMTRAYCLSSTLVNEYWYLSIVNGQLTAYNRPTCCPSPSSSSAELVGEPSASGGA